MFKEKPSMNLKQNFIFSIFYFYQLKIRLFIQNMILNLFFFSYLFLFKVFQSPFQTRRDLFIFVIYHFYLINSKNHLHLHRYLMNQILLFPNLLMILKKCQYLKDHHFHHQMVYAINLC